MLLENRLHERLDLQQQLSLNASILQSLEILRLPLQDLRDLLIDKSYENPLLELSEPILPEGESLPIPREKPKVDSEAEFDDATVEIYGVHNDLWTNGRRRTSESSGDADLFLAMNAEELTFADMLAEQLGAMRLDESMAAQCRYLLACLDRRGYLAERVEDIAPLLGCDVRDVQDALAVLQSLEPAGVGARTLEECLLLQLAREPDSTLRRHCEHLIREGLELMAGQDAKAIASLLQIDKEMTREVCEMIYSFTPIPSQGYHTGENRQTIIPDASVEKYAGGFRVTYNQRLLPAVSINSDYVRMIPLVDERETKDYLRQNLNEARQLIKAVERRESTLTRIIEQIVRLQSRFFEDGYTLAPMTLEDIAAELELNISTISRAIQGKYIDCLCGVVEIKKLFTKGIRRDDGQSVSSAMIKRRIQALVDGENPARPLSDESISQSLQQENMAISRRTVAKYRDELGIPSSSGRKKRRLGA